MPTFFSAVVNLTGREFALRADVLTDGSGIIADQLVPFGASGGVKLDEDTTQIVGTVDPAALDNLCPHEVAFRTGNGGYVRLPGAATPARVDEAVAFEASVPAPSGVPGAWEDRARGAILIPIRTGGQFGAVTGLPDPVPGRVYVVSLVTAQAASRAGRTDVVSPDSGPGRMSEIDGVKVAAGLIAWGPVDGAVIGTAGVSIRKGGCYTADPELPAAQRDFLLVVPPPVAVRAAELGRTDVVTLDGSPKRAVRDAKGIMVGSMGFVRFPVPRA